MKVLIVGASGHIGSAAAAALSQGNEIIAVSRSTQPKVDVSDPGSIERLFQTIGPVDAVVSAIGTTPFKAVTELARDDYINAFMGKTLSQIDLVRIGLEYVNPGGSFTLTSGILAREPIPTGSAASLANGAVEAFVRAAAGETPRGIRINAVSPTVLLDAPAYHGAFPGFEPITSDRVGKAFVRAVSGILSGHIYELD